MDISLMSAPAANAFGPSPVTMITRTAGSASIASAAVTSSSITCTTWMRELTQRGKGHCPISSLCTTAGAVLAARRLCYMGACALVAARAAVPSPQPRSLPSSTIASEVCVRRGW